MRNLSFTPQHKKKRKWIKISTMEIYCRMFSYWIVTVWLLGNNEFSVLYMCKKFCIFFIVHISQYIFYEHFLLAFGNLEHKFTKIGISILNWEFLSFSKLFLNYLLIFRNMSLNCSNNLRNLEILVDCLKLFEDQN